MQEKRKKQIRGNAASGFNSDFNLKSFCLGKAGGEHYLISLLISCNSIRLFQALLLAVVLVTGLVVAKHCLDWLRQIFFFFLNRKQKMIKKDGD